MKTLGRYFFQLLFLALLALLVALVFMPSAKNGKPGAPTSAGPRGGRPSGKVAGGTDTPAPNVLVAKASIADVPVYLDSVGTVKALNSVLVRAQVDGLITSISFKEGDDVNKGDVLATIDPATYQAALDQAIAKKAQDDALLQNGQRDLARYVRLAATNAVTAQQSDTQRATVAQLGAQVQSDVAAIDNARNTLSYTKVIAPIAGRTGLRNIDAGNQIHAADATGIVTITQVKPIGVLFNAPQQELARINTAMAIGAVKVLITNPQTGTTLDEGILKVVDNQIDQTTGTVKLKAEFPNSTLQLWPGAFVNVRLLQNTLIQAIILPAGALQRGPDGTFVYVEKGNQVKLVPVKVGYQSEADVVITSGIAAGDEVVTSGFAQLSDGAKVVVAGSASSPDAKQGGASPAQKSDGKPDAPSPAPSGAPSPPSSGASGQGAAKKSRRPS